MSLVETALLRWLSSKRSPVSLPDLEITGTPEMGWKMDGNGMFQNPENRFQPSEIVVFIGVYASCNVPWNPMS